jgi:hypothetical protein
MNGNQVVPEQASGNHVPGVRARAEVAWHNEKMP